MTSASRWPSALPDTALRRWSRPLVRFLHTESASGIVLLVCTAAALVAANSPFSQSYADFWHTKAGFSAGAFQLKLSLEEWINDGLMTIFFFVIGLEIKREMVFGELREFRKAALPILGALGGMIVPAGIFLALQAGQPGESGWGIPMATDIAFVVGFLALLGPRVPLGLKIFLLTLAIADDIGAILVIAVFYAKGLSLPALAGAGAGFALLIALNAVGVRSTAVYVLAGIGIWFAVLQSGVHPTVAGVLLGLLTPARPWIDALALERILAEALERLRKDSECPGTKEAGRVAESLALAAREVNSPLQRLETGWHPWVAFVIMPIFALANAGVPIEMRAVRDPLALAVTVGLFLGKPIGIVGVAWLGVRAGLARLPAGVSWNLMLAAGCLGGIGFTMSLFITGLAFDPAALATDPNLLDAGKIGTLAGSACSAVVGWAWAYLALPRNQQTA